ncbi:SDR family NAD(P)-dependent oxidoreductase [Gracilibacillus dipsosauri]|uniref:Oxidoreductase n=1 Tax=Gracilibacillus dipsosauri TaxID=178340 RepID=A0A317L009_9BACI|nr:SDR family oxidoreductase [Gracilibacillus dipsosauri]PWU68584.1 oxidoreductase [Gracilibacillus dipsosauri]
MKSINGKKVLITGASNGIGAAVALELAKRGAIPIMVARSKDKLQTLQNRLKEDFQIEATYYPVDLLNLSEWKQVIERIKIENVAIDAIINNAGIGLFESLDKIEWKEVEKMLRLNNKALIYTTHAFLHRLKQRPEAHIINIASQAGKIATPKSAVYSATKSGVISFSNALRLELIDTNIRVMTVNIGPVKTNFFDHADPSGSYQNNVAKYMLEADYVAKKIVQAMFTKKREINLPYWMQVGAIVYQLFPATMEKVLHKQFHSK